MLNVQVKNLGRMAVLSLQGEIVIGQTETLRDAMESLPRMSSVILDLSRCTLLDAHGLGVLLQLREQSQATGVSFQVVNVSRPLGEVLRITRLDVVFQAGSAVQAHPLATGLSQTSPSTPRRLCLTLRIEEIATVYHL